MAGCRRPERRRPGGAGRRHPHHAGLPRRQGAGELLVVLTPVLAAGDQHDRPARKARERRERRLAAWSRCCRRPTPARRGAPTVCRRWASGGQAPRAPRAAPAGAAPAPPGPSGRRRGSARCARPGSGSSVLASTRLASRRTGPRPARPSPPRRRTAASATCPPRRASSCWRPSSTATRTPGRARMRSFSRAVRLLGAVPVGVLAVEVGDHGDLGSLLQVGDLVAGELEHHRVGGVGVEQVEGRCTDVAGEMGSRSCRPREVGAERRRRALPLRPRDRRSPAPRPSRRATGRWPS